MPQKAHLGDGASPTLIEDYLIASLKKERWTTPTSRGMIYCPEESNGCTS
jgi:hypothetical protein